MLTQFLASQYAFIFFHHLFIEHFLGSDAMLDAFSLIILLHSHIYPNKLVQ